MEILRTKKIHNGNNQIVQNKFQKKNIVAVFNNLIEKFKTNTFGEKCLFRDKQRQEIKNIIFQNFFKFDTNNAYSTLIIFGQPGLGKSLLLFDIKRDIEAQGFQYFEKQETLPIRCIFLNAMHYQNCFSFFSDLIYKINVACNINIRVELSSNLNLIIMKLEDQLKNILEKNYLIVIIDELENLLNKDRNGFEAIITFFNLQMQGFVKIGISNTLDLFSDVSKSTKVYLKFNFLVFKPYKEKTLVKLIQLKLKKNLPNYIQQEDLFSDKSFDFIAKKALKNKSCDMRFVLKVIIECFYLKLNVIEKNYELLDTVDKNDLKITIQEIMQILEDRFDKKERNMIINTSFNCKIIMFALNQIIAQKEQVVSVQQTLQQVQGLQNTFGFNFNEISISIDNYLDELQNNNIICIEERFKKSKRPKMIRLKPAKNIFEVYLKEIPQFAPYFNQF